MSIEDEARGDDKTASPRVAACRGECLLLVFFPSGDWSGDWDMLLVDASPLVREELSNDGLGTSGPPVPLRFQEKIRDELTGDKDAACCFATSWVTSSLAVTSGGGELERALVTL